MSMTMASTSLAFNNHLVELQMKERENLHDEQDGEQLLRTLGILVVPHELKEYSRMWGARHLVIDVYHDCIGAARYHIIQLARY